MLHFMIKQDLLVKNTEVHPYQETRPKAVFVNCTPNAEPINYYSFLLNNTLGQSSLLLKAKQSIASFKLRMDTPIGVQFSLHRQHLNSFNTYFNHLILPRLNQKSFPMTYGLNSLNVFRNSVTIPKHGK